MSLKDFFSSLCFPKALFYLCWGLIGGLLMGLTVAPGNLWFCAWIALIPLWLVVSQSSLFITTATAFIWGFSYHGLALFWITGIHPMTWMGVSWWNSLFIAIFCWLFITSWGAILVIIWAYICQRLINKKSHKIIFFNSSLFNIFFAVSIWCLLEKMWSWGSLWWTSLSFTQSPDNLALLQLLKFSGPTTITALIVLINCLLAEGLIYLIKYQNQEKFTSYVSVTLIILFSTHLLGFNLYRSSIINDTDKQIKVGLIQGNIPNEIKLYDPGLEISIENYSQGYQELAKNNVDIILTPETALPFFYQDIEKNSSFYPLIEEAKIPIFLGAFKRLDRYSYQNSLFTINGAGKVISRYDKIKLVPLGEYIPFKQILGDFISRLSPLDTYLIPGDKEQILTTPFGKAIAGICYDSAFSEIFRQQALKGGEFIITAANNAHYSNTMPRQHHAQDVMRAIETDRWMARATNTGYSAIVDPHGNTIWISEINQYQTHQDIIYRRDNLTFYVVKGDWLIILLTGFSFLYLMIKLLSYQSKYLR